MYEIFLADDEMWITIGLRKLIERSGLPFRVIGEANDGITALEEIGKNSPDVVFTDIRMPGITGLELLERISESKPDIKVVMISGYAEFEYAQRAMRMSAFDYLLKPIEQEKLDEVLKRLLRTFEKERAIAEEPMEQEEEKEATEVGQSVLDRIVGEIQKSYTDNITLTEFSEKYGISIGHLSSLLKAELGLSFSEYLAAKRVQKAKELLADETLSLDEIADHVGYHDYFYFIKVFKKVTGISPSKYRKMLQK